MKANPLVLVSLLAGSLLLAGCSTINSRINEKGQMFYSLDPDTRAKIEHGDIGVGYTPDMVYIALGKPDAKRFHTTNDGSSETWIYGTYYDYYDGAGYVGYRRWGGWHGGFYRMYWEPMYAPFNRPALSPETVVTFRDGKVTQIEQIRG